jgi:hypothetical protein
MANIARNDLPTEGLWELVTPNSSSITGFVKQMRYCSPAKF